MSQRDEVAVHTEAIYHREDDIHSGQHHNKIHANLRLDRRQHRKWQEAHGLQILKLVALTGVTGTDEVLDNDAQVRQMEVALEAVASALNTLVPVIMSGGNQLEQQLGRRQQVEAVEERHQAVSQGPGRARRTGW